MKTVKRFIAGAVCPRCAAMDRIVAYTDEDQRQVRECVACGFNEKLREVDTLAAQAPQPETRVTRKIAPLADQVKAQPIKFYPRMPGKKGKTVDKSEGSEDPASPE